MARGMFKIMFTNCTINFLPHGSSHLVTMKEGGMTNYNGHGVIDYVWTQVRSPPFTHFVRIQSSLAKYARTNKAKVIMIGHKS